MPLYSLHADYDQNGVLNASTSEYQSRNYVPGALIMPNIDVDGTALPGTVTCGNTPTPDFFPPTKSGGDNDLLPVAIIANTGTVTSQHRVEFKLADADAANIRVYDSGRSRMTGVSSGGFKKFTINFTGTRVDLFLEAATYTGSPALPGRGTSLRALLLAPPAANRFNITIDVFDAVQGNLIESDTGLISISPLILMGDHMPAERLYICEVAGTTASLSDNTPSLTDVRDVMRTVRGVALTTIPQAVHNGDSWVQDQFQLGYAQTATGAMKVILHLPRLRTDNRLSGTNSLFCIATDHFPSTGLGTCNDFWTRTLPVRDVDAGTQNIPFTQTVEVTMLFERVMEVNSYLLSVGQQAAPSEASRLYSTYFRFDLTSVINNLPDFRDDVLRLLNAAESRERDSVRRQRIQNTITDITNGIPALLREINFRSDGALAVRTANLRLALEPDDIEQIQERFDALHSSHNYGGNIEVTPAYTGAPLGKIVIGDATGANARSLLDPQLSDFLLVQGEQPILTLDTAWLKVGHVDEMVNFISSPGVTGFFATTLASPAIAQKILEEIFLLNTAHLSPDDPMSELYGAPYHLGDYSMARGPHPVTRLLRGKHWLQSYHTSGSFTTPPPEIYTWMNRYYGDLGISTRRYYPIPWPDDHYYDARISVREMLYFSAHSSRLVQEKIDTAKERLERDFGEMPFIELPVFFDEYNPDYQQTIAFTPDLVNFQTVNDHILIPRPYGPRMSIPDAIAVLTNVMDRGYHQHLNRRYIIRRNLNKTFHWTVDTINELSHVITGPYNRPVTVDLDYLAQQFKDGFFPETEDLDEIKRRIRAANPGKFMPNGNLRTGWHRIEIPENKVDLFELYTQIMLESLHVNVHWVDSWYYHVRSGGIHCGTNVIRTPDASQANAWWNVQPGMGPGDYVVPSGDTRYA